MSIREGLSPVELRLRTGMVLNPGLHRILPGAKDVPGRLYPCSSDIAALGNTSLEPLRLPPAWKTAGLPGCAGQALSIHHINPILLAGSKISVRIRLDFLTRLLRGISLPGKKSQRRPLRKGPAALLILESRHLAGKYTYWANNPVFALYNPIYNLLLGRFNSALGLKKH
jgi:hypothetical protein